MLEVPSLRTTWSARAAFSSWVSWRPPRPSTFWCPRPPRARPERSSATTAMVASNSPSMPDLEQHGTSTTRRPPYRPPRAPHATSDPHPPSGNIGPPARLSSLGRPTRCPRHRAVHHPDRTTRWPKRSPSNSRTYWCRAARAPPCRSTGQRRRALGSCEGLRLAGAEPRSSRRTPFVQLQRRTQLPPQQIDLRHRLEIEPAILAGLQREAVLPERLLVIPLLSERQAEVEMGEGGTGANLAGSGAAGCGAASLRRRSWRPSGRPACPPDAPSSKRSSARFACAFASVGFSAMARLVAARAASCWPRSP